MANDSRSGRKNKNEENSTPQKKLTTDTLALRRSTREFSSMKQTTLSPSHMRKSERLEKRVSTTPPVNKEAERVENQVSPTPLRRSDRGKKQTSSNSSGSKKSEKRSGTSYMKRKKGFVNDKVVKRLTLESTEIKKIERRDSELVVGRKRKRMDGRSYKALFKAQRRRNTAADEDDNDDDNDDDDDVEQPFKASQVDNNSGGTSGVVEVENNKCSRKIGEKLREECVEKASQGASRRTDSSLRNSGRVEVELSFSNWKHNEHSDGDGVKTLKSGIVKNTLYDAGKMPVECSKKEKLRAMESVGSATVVSKEVSETCNACFKRRRVDHDSENEDLCSCNVPLSKGLSDTSISEDRGELEAAAAATGLDEKCDSVVQWEKNPLDFQTEVNETMCFICKLGGELMCCNGNGCKRSYHLSCLDPLLNETPPGVWHCNRCVMKKIEKGVHSVSKGVESIWDFREVEVSVAEGFQRQKRYFVKYEGLAHIHNKWVPETQLLLEAPLLVTKYKLKDQAVKWNADWTVPHRVLKKRLLMPFKQRIEYLNEHGGAILSCHYEWLVRWSGLDYEHATWELENSSFLMSTKGQKLIKEYENRLQRAQQAVSSVNKSKKESLVKLSKLPAGSQPGIDNNHLNIVNKLREYWYKGQSAVVFEERERAMKIVIYILSLSNVSQPFLIITTSNSLSYWESEFSRLAPSIDVVVYSGNKYNRKCIRILEFYGEGDRTMFQVLLSSMEAVVEDLQMLPSLRWEAIIVDKCQCSRISTHFEQINKLVTDAKLIIFSGPVKESIAEYQNLLSFLDCCGDLANNDVSESKSNDNLGKLKERLTEYIASECKFSRFVEFWVPVQISNLQLEQYCATLLSNSSALCSSKKHDAIGALRDTLISSRKCCNHPYLVNEFIQGSITKDLPIVEYLDVGIKASGKLQLLDVILSELKNRQLRVLILFQGIGGSGKITMGDILDDFLRQRFGPDSYERIDAVCLTSKKQAAMNKFNNKESTQFVFLLETRACLSSIKLCSVDTVVIFDSDWNPSNDLKALHKISIDSQFEQLKIFRLYSSCTVEEKVLINAKKHNLALDSNIQSLSRSTIETLLMWGALYLFTALDEFCIATIASISSEQSILNNVVKEFLDILSHNDDKIDDISNPMIVKVQHSGGGYSTSLSLLGELKIQLSDRDQPHVFWTKLLEGRNPRWKFLPAQNQRQRKRVQHFSELPEKRGAENDEVGKKRKKVVSHVKPVVEGTSKVHTDNGPHSFPKSVASFTDTLDVVSDPASKPLFSGDRTLSDSQKSLHLLLKPDISRLCEILKLSDDVKVIVEQFLGYVVENHHVSREPASIFQAFELSMCWIAASLLKHKIDRKESLSLAKEHLQFVCKEEEAESVYSKLRLLKKEFLSHNENIVGPDFTKLTTEDTTKQAPNAQVSPSLPFIPKDVKVEIVERSQIEEFSDDRVRFKTGSEEISDLIKSIQRKCEKRMAKLLQKQQEEIQEFHKIWEDKRLELEDKHRLESAVVRTIHRNLSGRLDKLKVLDNELEKKIKEHNRQKDISLKDLEAKQLHARNDERDKAAHWLAEAKSSASDDDRLLNGPENVDPTPTACGAVPPGTTENVPDGPDIGIQNALVNQIPENNEVVSEKGTQNALGNLDYEKTVSTSPPCLQKQIPDRNISSVRGEEISSEPPQTVLCGLGNFDPVETGTPAAESDQENARTEAVSSDTPNVVGNPSNEANNSSNNNDPPSLVNVPSVQPVIYLTSEQPLPQNLERQNECPQSLESTEMRDECTPVQIPPLDNIDHSHSDLPPAAGPTPELQGPTTPSQNIADLPPAGGPTPELQGPTISQNIDNLCPASGPTHELHGPTTSQNVSNLPVVSGSTSEVLGPTTSQNVANLRPVSGPTSELQEPTTSQNVADLPLANGPTPQLPPASGPIRELQVPITSQNVADIPPTSGPELQWSTPLQNAGASTQLADDPTNEAIIQGTYHHPPSHTEQQVAPRTATLPLYVDPLQNELDRIRRDREQTFRAHEDTKLKLNFECEKEIEEMIAQIRRKYEVKHQDAEVAFLVKKNELDTNHSIVLMNKILAEAFRSKCLDLSPSGPSKMQQDVPSSFLQQLRQVATPSAPRVSPLTSYSAGPPAATQLAAWPAPRVSTSSSVAPPAATQLAGSSPRVSTSSSAGPPLATQYGSAPRGLGVTNSSTVPPLATPQITVPPLQIVNQSAALFSSVPTRPLTINPITPSAGNHRAGGGEIRAPAPHLQFRPPPMPTPNATPLLRAMPSPSPPPASPPPSMMAPPQLPPLATNSSGINSRPPQPEGTGGLQTPTHRLSPSSSMMAPPPPTAQPPPPQLPPLATNSFNLASRPPQPEGTNGLQTPYSLSALELMMDMDRRPNANVHHPNFLPPLPDFDSNFAPLDLSEFGPPVTTQVSSTPPTIAADVVCLSDDDD